MHYKPHLLEYHPVRQDRIVLGTTDCRAVVWNTHFHKTVEEIRGGKFADDSNDSITGLCWLNSHQDSFAACSKAGNISIFSMSTVVTTQKVYILPEFKKPTSIHIDLTDQVSRSVIPASSSVSLR